MSSKIKKTSENMSFSLSRWFRRASTNAPITFLVTLLGMSYAIFLFGGGLFTLINHPIPVYPTSTGFIFLYPDISNQFGADTFISIALYALGFIGLLTMYQSSKSAYKPRQAYMLLIIGVAFLLISYIFLEGAISFKTSQGS
jgi:hypothetical protein